MRRSSLCGTGRPSRTAHFERDSIVSALATVSFARLGSARRRPGDA